MKKKEYKMETRTEKWKDLREKIDQMNVFYKNASLKTKIKLRKAERNGATR